MTTNSLKTTSWLAKRLGLSVSTIERLRARGKGDLPPHITVGLHTIRYDEVVVEAWLIEQQHGPVSMLLAAPAPKTTQAPRKNVFGKRLIPAPTTA